MGTEKIEQFIHKEEIEKIVRFYLERHRTRFLRRGINTFALTVAFTPFTELNFGNFVQAFPFSIMGDHITFYENRTTFIRVMSNKKGIFFLNRKKSRKRLLRILAHELDHLLWAYENRGRFDHSSIYIRRPHEKRARRNERYWAFRFRTLLEKK